MSKVLVWLKGLAAALVGGTIAGAAQAAASGNIEISKLKVSALTGAALTLSAYLTQSPVAASGTTPAAIPAAAPKNQAQ